MRKHQEEKIPVAMRLDVAHDPPNPESPRHGSLTAWELIEPGRYMPRRIRGSFPGRELG
jgi:hypothetical protein